MPIALAAIVLAFVALFGFSRIAHAATEAITVNTVRPDTFVVTNAPYEVSELNQAGGNLSQHIPPSVTTVHASSVTASTAQLNGYYNIGTAFTVLIVSFEYGTSPSDLAYGTTPYEVNILSGSGNHTRTIGGLANNTKYYYRIVARYDGKTVYGQTKSFTTGATVSQSTSNTGTGSSTGTTTNTSSSNGGTTVSSSNTGTGTSSAASATATASASTASNTFARLSITDNESTIERGDEVTYTVTYEARQALRDATLTIELPKGMTVLKSSRGNVDKTDRMVVVELGNPSAGSQRTITIDARMSGSVRDGESLKATAELQFETVSGSIRSLSATDTTEFIGGSSALGASLFGTGVSLSFFNWLVVAGIIAVIIILARKQFQSA